MISNIAFLILLVRAAAAAITQTDEAFCKSLPNAVTMGEVARRCALAKSIGGSNLNHPGLTFGKGFVDFKGFGQQLEELLIPIQITDSDEVDISLPYLESIMANGEDCFRISSNAKLRTVALPKLKKITCKDGLLIEQNGLKEISLQLNQLTAASINISENKELSKFKLVMIRNWIFMCSELKFIHNKEGFCPELKWDKTIDTQIIFDHSIKACRELERLSFSEQGGISFLAGPEEGPSYLLVAIIAIAIAITVGAITFIAIIIYLKLKKSTESSNELEVTPAGGEEAISRGIFAEESERETESALSMTIEPAAATSVEKEETSVRRESHGTKSETGPSGQIKKKDEAKEIGGKAKQLKKKTLAKLPAGLARGGTRWDDIVLPSGKTLKEFEGQILQENPHLEGVLQRMREGAPLPFLEEIRRPTPPQLAVESFQDLLDRGLRTPSEFYGHFNQWTKRGVVAFPPPRDLSMLQKNLTVDDLLSDFQAIRAAKADARLVKSPSAFVNSCQHEEEEGRTPRATCQEAAVFTVLNLPKKPLET